MCTLLLVVHVFALLVRYSRYFNQHSFKKKFPLPLSLSDYLSYTDFSLKHQFFNRISPFTTFAPFESQYFPSYLQSQ